MNSSTFFDLVSPLHDEFNNISYNSPEEAIRQGDYSWALRNAESEDLGRKLENLLGVRGGSERFSPELLPSAYDIFSSGGHLPTGRKIRVLVQMMEAPQDSSRGYAKNLRKSSRYDVVNIGFYDDADIKMHPGMTLVEIQSLLGDWIPDFYYCHQVEYMCVPVGLDKAPYPVFGHVGDADLHWINSKDILGMFDLLTVVGSYDHWQTCNVTDRPVVVYPKIYGCQKFKRKHFSVRPHDILFTGTSKDLYRWDTQVFLRALTQVKASFPIVDGFLSEIDYSFLMGESKIVPTYVRRWGAFSTRGLEALSMGSCILYQEGGEMGLFFTPEEGAVPYRSDNLELKVSDVLKGWKEKYEHAGKRGALKARSEFSMEQVVEGYFDFLSFLAFSTDMGKAISSRKQDLLIRTPALIYGWRGIHGESPPTHGLEMYEYTVNIRIQPEKKIELLSAQFKSKVAMGFLNLSLMGAGDLKREYGSELVWYFNLGRYKFNQFLKQRFDLLSRQDELHPHLHSKLMKNDLAIEEAVRLELELVSLFTEALSVNLGSDLDVYDYTFFSEGFDYRSYFDLLWRGSDRGILGADARMKAESIIHAYCHAHLFLLTRDLVYFWNALRNHPQPHLLRFILAHISPVEFFALIRNQTVPENSEYDHSKLLFSLIDMMSDFYPCELQKSIPWLKEVAGGNAMEVSLAIDRCFTLGGQTSRANTESTVRRLKRWLGKRYPNGKRAYRWFSDNFG